MVTNSIYWQIPLLFAIVAIGAEVFLFDVSTPKYFRVVRLHLINFLLFVFVLSGVITILGLIVQGSITLSLFAATSGISIFGALFVMIWLVPTEKPHLGETLTIRTSVNYGLSDRVVARKRVGLKTILTIFIFLLPLVLIVHVQKNQEFYLSNLRNYKTFTIKDLPTQSSTYVLHSSSVLAEYVETMNLHFLSAPKLQCGQSDTACLSLRNLIQSIQDNRLFFIVKVSYYFAVLYLILTYYGRVVQIHYHHKPKDPDSLGLQNDVIKQCSEIVSISLSFLLALVIAGVDFTSLGVFGGLIGAGLSVALKDLLGNVVAGVLLLWDRTIKKDDVITVSPSSSSDTGSTYAIVQRMTMRYTIVQDRNDVRRLIPNSVLTNNIVENWTHEDKLVRLRVLVGVDYDTDLRLARTILEAVCYEVSRIETKDHPPKAVVIGFGDHAINFALRFYITDPETGIRPVISDLYIGIYERFKKEGIKIPYPRRDLHILTADDQRAPLEPDLVAPQKIAHA